MKPVLTLILGLLSITAIGLFGGGSAGAAATQPDAGYDVSRIDGLRSSIWSSTELALLDAHNAARRGNNRSEFGATNVLGRAAAIRCNEIIKKFSHTRPNGKSPFSVLNKFNIRYSSAGENIAKGYSSVSSVMQAWMNSSGHRSNILNRGFDQVGLGHCQDSNGGNYWVALFINKP